MNTWTGHLATLGTPTPKGAILALPEQLLHRPLPLPLLGHGNDFIGLITRVFIHGDRLRAEGVIEAGLMQPDQRLPIAITLDGIAAEAAPHGPITTTITHWRLAGATAHPRLTPEFPDAHITLRGPR